MSEAKFTKGPWEALENTAFWEVGNKGGLFIMSMENTYAKVDERQQQANAYLIAVAPEMYEEIEQDIQWLESMMPKFVCGSYEFGSICRRIETKRKLLAKARGETK